MTVNANAFLIPARFSLYPCNAVASVILTATGRIGCPPEISTRSPKVDNRISYERKL